MAIIYDEGVPSKGGFNSAILSLDPNACWNKHYENWCYLKFIRNNTNDYFERGQAQHEIEIAEKKMQFWERKYDFDRRLMEKKISQEKKRWNDNE